jgi:hypothetical protein
MPMLAKSGLSFPRFLGANRLFAPPRAGNGSSPAKNVDLPYFRRWLCRVRQFHARDCRAVDALPEDLIHEHDHSAKRH